jgi:3-deoxy-D-manno-octulosonic-acid transferase
MFLLYNIIIFFALPFWLILLWHKQKGQFRLKERLGFLTRTSKSPVWIHGVSLGEVKLAIRLGNNLINKGYSVLITSTTAAGLSQLENEKFPFAAFPLDFILFQKLALARVRPKAVILLETEIWPSLLKALTENSVPHFIINGRMSERKYSNYLKYKGYFKSLLSACWISASSETYAGRFLSLGLDSSRIVVHGNMKFDLVASANSAKDADFFNSVKAFFPEVKPPVWIAGSIREGEEEIILGCHNAVKSAVPLSRLIIAPRHLERVGKILELCWSLNLRPKLRSEFPDSDWDVLVLDTYGELSCAYSLADAAFIGGSILDYGGQNPLEPAVYKIPVLFGKYMNNFTDEADLLIKGEGALQVSTETEITGHVLSLLTNKEKAHIIGYNAFILLNKSIDSTERTVEWLLQKV